VLLLSMCAAIAAILYTTMPMRDTVLLASWVLVLISTFCLIAHIHRALSDSMEFRKVADAQLSTLTKTLMTAESAIAEKDRALAQNRAEISRLAESNSVGRQQVSILRNEVGVSKTRLEEGRQLLERLRRRAEMSDRLTAALMANINDVLRNPLNAIIGYTSLLRNSQLSESRKAEYIDIITRDSRRFLDVVNDLFYYSRLVVGDVEAVVTTFNVNALLQNSVSMARHLVRESGKEIEVGLSQCAGSGFIGGFEAGYIKILGNLLSNAVKFTHEGHVDVSCVVDGGMVRISVKDTGIGFSPEVRDSIFDAFRQGDLSLTRRYHGTGLGLAISRTLARLMGGDILAEGHEGSGCRFTVEIPLSSPSDADMDIYERVSKLLNNNTSRGRVLMKTPFNEDFDFVRRFMAHYDIEVVRSASAEESDTLLREYSDIRMAVIDLYSWALEGVEAAERIFRLRPGVRFAFISNGTLEPLQIEAIRAYSDIILSKPLSSLALSNVLAKW